MKRPIPFLHQKRDALKAVGDVFANTNVLRSATREAMVEIRDLAQEFINTLDDDEQAGVKDASDVQPAPKPLQETKR